MVENLEVDYVANHTFISGWNHVQPIITVSKS